MGKVVFNNSVSLDGFVAGLNDAVDELFRWFYSGDTVVPLSLKVLSLSNSSAPRGGGSWRDPPSVPRHEVMKGM